MARALALISELQCTNIILSLEFYNACRQYGFSLLHFIYQLSDCTPVDNSSRYSSALLNYKALQVFFFTYTCPFFFFLTVSIQLFARHRILSNLLVSSNLFCFCIKQTARTDGRCHEQLASET